MGGLEADVNPEQQYSLRWNDFHASILSSFRHLRDEEDFVDVTLACDGCSFTAHKVVLSACSPYFRKLLKANPCQHPIVILRDVQQKDMESLLRFMYNGEVHIGQEQLADFLKTAQMLQVRGLADVPAGVPNQRIVTAPDQKISPSSTSLPWPTDLQSPRGRDSGSPPPLKRSRSSDQPTRGTYSPDRVRTPSRGNGAEMRESLLGQALEGGPTLHTNTNSTNQKGNNSESSLQAQSTGEDSNSSSTALSDRGGPVTPKTEPSDYPMLEDHPLLNTNGSGPGPGMMDQSRTFPGALLGLQGISGLLPGPSGMHNNGPESFDYRQGSRVDQLDHEGATPYTQQYPQPTGERSLNLAGYECPLCEAHLPTLVDIRQHIDVHYPRDSPVCPVDICARRFTHPNSVRNHMRLKHTAQWEKMKNLKWST